MRYDVSIIGAGYVGLPLAVTFAESGCSVLVVDVVEPVVAAINRGESHIEDIANDRLAPLVEQGLVRATSDYADMKEAAGIDPFRRHREMEVLASLHPRALLEDRLQDLPRRARPRRRLEHDHLPPLDDRCQAPGGALDVGEVRLALARERRRQRDQHRVCVLHLVVVARGNDEPFLRQHGQALGSDVLDVALAPVEGVHDVGLHVDEQHPLAGLPEGGRERHTDIAGADHGKVVLR